ncbi:MAG: hypothetical protein CVU12_08725 [Bacteroidetes bacterium HGW-Bacteroidetes-7]|jgi:hypothetical protein|nr:MAG: hypothetical protein CVU12_08725 [Bacteroidetes bacterium HGW-Bacteroidetes-7]
MDKNSFTIKALAILLAGAILFSSCASSTMIYSSPDGAKVFLNGEPVGKTPYLHTDTKIVGSTTTVRLEKEGYNPFYTTFSRDEEVDVGAIIGGIFVWVPFLWTMKYKASHTYEMVPLSLDEMTKSNAVQQDSTKNSVEKLRELKQMLDEKLITQEEFDKAKKKILETPVN